MTEQLSFDLPPPAQSLFQLWSPDEVYDRINADNVHLFTESRRIERKGVNVQRNALADSKQDYGCASRKRYRRTYFEQKAET